MKNKLVFLLLALVIYGGVQAQSGKTSLPVLHAYSKEVLGGAAPVETVDETGNTKQRTSKPSVQYYFYMEAATKQTLRVQYIWMEGKAYKVTLLPITTPVVLPGTPTLSGPVGDTIIARSKNSFWKVELNGIASGVKQKASVTKLQQSNALVADCIYKGKACLVTGKTIKKLSPLVLQ
jgi:hypothetical protein